MAGVNATTVLAEVVQFHAVGNRTHQGLVGKPMCPIRTIGPIDPTPLGDLAIPEGGNTPRPMPAGIGNLDHGKNPHEIIIPSVEFSRFPRVPFRHRTEV